MQQLNITIRDTVKSLSDGKIQKTVKNGKTHYRVWIYLEGLDLPLIERVKYVLHPQLNIPPKIINRSPDNPNCVTTFWTYGIFTLTVLVEDKSRRIHTFTHKLEFGNELTPVSA